MRKTKADWVVVGGAPGEYGHCTRCGEALRMLKPVRIEVWAAAAKAFAKVHSECPPGMHYEKPPMTPEEWALGGDTGVSSLTIYSVMTGHRWAGWGCRDFDAPYDPADFGRCYRLLKLFPHWRPRLGEVAAACPRFAGIVREWNALCELWEKESPTGTCPQLYARIQELRAEDTA